MTRRIRKAYASRGDDSTLSRFVKTRDAAEQMRLALDGGRQVAPKVTNRAAVREGRTIFPRSVRAVGEVKTVLVSGHSNAKIGRDVRKGHLRGYWIYTLSLEERATCPRSCHHWATCYGNNMPYAKRISHEDPERLVGRLAVEIRDLLAVRGRAGILVRLHALGDFYSPDYVRQWGILLRMYPRLAVFGYTAWPRDSAIGREIDLLKRSYGSRFAIRWSNGGEATDCTVPIQSVAEAGAAIVCPEQTGQTQACATCALCWSTSRNIAFLEH